MKPPSKAAWLDHLTSRAHRNGGPAVDGAPDPDGALNHVSEPRVRRPPACR
jgi:hypothetical protein